MLYPKSAPYMNSLVLPVFVFWLAIDTGLKLSKRPNVSKYPPNWSALNGNLLSLPKIGAVGLYIKAYLNASGYPNSEDLLVKDVLKSILSLSLNAFVDNLALAFTCSNPEPSKIPSVFL